MAYTLKRSLNGLSFEDIKRIYDNNPNMTLKELSNLTGFAIPFLKKILLEDTKTPAAQVLDDAFNNPVEYLKKHFTVINIK